MSDMLIQAGRAIEDADLVAWTCGALARYQGGQMSRVIIAGVGYDDLPNVVAGYIELAEVPEGLRLTAFDPEGQELDRWIIESDPELAVEAAKEAVALLYEEARHG